MPKFTLIKHRDTENDAEVSGTFTTDELGLAKDHLDDFLKASGFEIPLDERMSGYTVRSKSEWEWDDNGEFKFDSLNLNSDVIKFPKRFNKND